MNCFFRSRLTRTAGVLALLVAWFAVSNHCALLAMQSGAANAAAGACCHSTSAGHHGEPKSSRGVCCKLLRAVPLASGANLVNVASAREVFDLVWEPLRALALPERFLPVGVETTGPPRAVSFAGSVLQRSLRSLAPPFVV